MHFFVFRKVKPNLADIVEFLFVLQNSVMSILRLSLNSLTYYRSNNPQNAYSERLRSKRA